MSNGEFPISDMERDYEESWMKWVEDEMEEAGEKVDDPEEEAYWLMQEQIREENMKAGVDNKREDRVRRLLADSVPKSYVVDGNEEVVFKEEHLTIVRYGDGVIVRCDRGLSICPLDVNEVYIHSKEL